ncbi:MAG: hypothetical protein H7645_03880 [Candidatus Heimdallarchaeota archaeon]|nr:hypothetical protein [Candidatus Heimdallarchaeota archaeon]MCK4769456.1 hypothetical protein [Candidatus Heimdallarchaeota archaeon]
MAYTPYSGIFTGGFLTFMVVFFGIITLLTLIWFFLYVEMSERKDWKTGVLISVINVLLIAFEIQMILLKTNVIF